MKKIKLRSQSWFNNPDNPSMTALYLERYLNYGLTREELQEAVSACLLLKSKGMVWDEDVQKCVSEEEYKARERESNIIKEMELKEKKKDI